ncbi:MAG: putative outer membrane protein [Prosthecobacter sp.]|nr:putative outer membrane protein [Prosthecobacter sp.]
MKSKSITRLTSATFALCSMFALASNGIAAPKDTLDAADVKFVKTESAAGIAELKLAELGVQKAERADVKAFAGMLVTDHTQANKELAALATEKGVEVSAVIDSKHADTFQKLEKAGKSDFDKEFLADMISDHKKCVSNFEEAAKDAKNSDVKTWAGKMLPALKAHLAKAKELAAK